jgi:hypothetical protein
MPVIIPISEVKQNTPQWHLLRLGIPTSSQFSRILTTSGKRSASWQGYVDELAIEKLSGTVNTFETWQMRLGHKQEPMARWLYGQMNCVEVQEIAFIFRDERRRVGSSTDGLVGNSGIFEAKGGEGKTHLERLRKYRANKVKFEESFIKEHFCQCQGELYVADREWVDLFAYFPGMQPLEFRVYRDENWIKTLDFELEYFYNDLADAIEFARQQ